MEIDYAQRAKELKDLIINKPDLPIEEVKVPEWDLPFPIYIRTMSALEKDELETEQFIKKGEKIEFSLINLRAVTLSRVMCADPEGKYRIFTDPNDVIELGKKSASAIDRCLEVSRRLNGTSEQDEKDMVKNLQGQDEDSGLDKQD